LAATSLAVGGAVSAQSPSAPAPGAGIKVGVVTDVGRLDDKSFNEFSNQGAIDAVTALGGTHDVIVTEEIADYAANIQTFVDEGYDAIVTIGFLIGTDTLNAAKANPDVKFIGVDQGICVDAEGNNDPTFACEGDAAALIPNYQGILFNEAQPGYLAGIVAATLSESGTIGAVGGTNVPAVVAYRDGYINGAKSVNADINVLYQESNPDPVIGFNDPERGAEIAGQMIDLGADVIFQIAGATGEGVLEAACSAGIYGIGVDVDQWQSTHDQAECIVTSAEKHLTKAVTEGIQAFAGDGARSGNVFYGADNDGVGVAPYYQFDGNVITDAIKTAVSDAFDQMGSGDLDPCQPSNKCYAGTEDPGT
jgi:basic membrane protein A